MFELKGIVMETVFSIISLFISLIAIIVVYLTFRGSHRTSVQPMIVFSNAPAEVDYETSWCIENVGNGPALNVLVAGGTTHLKWNQQDITLIPVIGKNTNKRLIWIKQKGALLATYKDIYGYEYTSICVGNQHTISDGNNHKDLKPAKYAYQLTETSK